MYIYTYTYISLLLLTIRIRFGLITFIICCNTFVYTIRSWFCSALILLLLFIRSMLKSNLQHFICMSMKFLHMIFLHIVTTFVLMYIMQVCYLYKLYDIFAVIYDIFISYMWNDFNALIFFVKRKDNCTAGNIDITRFYGNCFQRSLH